jgi:HSP90 family molecular chaperone
MTSPSVTQRNIRNGSKTLETLSRKESLDSENKDALFRLLRFTTRNGGSKELVSIDDYISKMKEG